MLSLLHVILKHMDQVIKNQQDECYRDRYFHIILMSGIWWRAPLECIQDQCFTIGESRRRAIMENLGTWYLVLGCVADTWYLVLAGHHGEFR